MRTNREPITSSEELDILYARVLDETDYSDAENVESLIEPAMTLSGNDHYASNDAINWLVANGARIPSITELDNDYGTVIWSLLSEKKIEAILTKAIKDAEADNEEQEKQDAEVAVATLEKQLAAAKETLAAKTNKGSKSR